MTANMLTGLLDVVASLRAGPRQIKSCWRSLVRTLDAVLGARA